MNHPIEGHQINQLLYLRFDRSNFTVIQHADEESTDVCRISEPVHHGSPTDSPNLLHGSYPSFTHEQRCGEGTMVRTMNVAREADQSHGVVSYDLAIASKAYTIQALEAPIFDCPTYNVGKFPH
jgi:hypothetical protein